MYVNISSRKLKLLFEMIPGIKTNNFVSEIMRSMEGISFSSVAIILCIVALFVLQAFLSLFSFSFLCVVFIFQV